MEMKIPESWKAWKLKEKLGKGGFGTVYLAEHEDGRACAIKCVRISAHDDQMLLPVEAILDPESIRKYYQNLVRTREREVRTMMQLRNEPHVVYIEDSLVEEAEEAGTWYLWIRMELLTSLPDYLKGRELSEADVTELGLQMCDALSACEHIHILHRDIKPQNILVAGEGWYKLGDFGAVKRLDGTTIVSNEGTVDYAAPEAAIPEGIIPDHRADIYSLGIVMYQLLNNGHIPFTDVHSSTVTRKDKDTANARRLHKENLPAPLHGSQQLQQAVLKACAPDPEDRFSGAAEFKEALLACGKPEKKNLKKPLLICLGMAAVFIAGAMGIKAWTDRQQPGNKRHVEEPVTETVQENITETEMPVETEEETVWSTEPGKVILLNAGSSDAAEGVSVRQIRTEHKNRMKNPMTFLIDPDEDGKTEKLSVSWGRTAGENGRKERISVTYRGRTGSMPDGSALEVIDPYVVCSGDKQYLYLFCIDENDALYLEVCDLNGEAPVYVGTMQNVWLQQGGYDGYSEAFTDPCSFIMESSEHSLGEMILSRTYHTGRSGMPQADTAFADCRAAGGQTHTVTLEDIPCQMISETTLKDVPAEGERVICPANTSLTWLHADFKGHVDMKSEDGIIYRFTMDADNHQMLGNTPVEKLFS